jgi:RNase P/RNase MRP subunit p30
MTNDEAFHALSTVPQNILAKNEIRDQIIIPGVRLPKQRSQRDYEA